MTKTGVMVSVCLMASFAAHAQDSALRQCPERANLGAHRGIRSAP